MFAKNVKTSDFFRLYKPCKVCITHYTMLSEDSITCSHVASSGLEYCTRLKKGTRHCPLLGRSTSSLLQSSRITHCYLIREHSFCSSIYITSARRLSAIHHQHGGKAVASPQRFEVLSETSDCWCLICPIRIGVQRTIDGLQKCPRRHNILPNA